MDLIVTYNRTFGLIILIPPVMLVIFFLAHTHKKLWLFAKIFTTTPVHFGVILTNFTFLSILVLLARISTYGQCN